MRSPRPTLCRGVRTTAVLSLLAALAAPCHAQRPDLSWHLTDEQVSEGRLTPTQGEVDLSAGSLKFAGTDDGRAVILGEKTPAMTAGRKDVREFLPKRTLTIEAWVAVDRPQKWGGMFSALEDNGNHERGVLLGTRNNRFVFGLCTAGGADKRMTYLEGPPAFLPGRFYHVVGTYDGVEMCLYVDANLAGRSEAQAGDILWDETHDLALGRYHDKDESHALLGSLHSVSVFDKALKPRQIEKRYRKRPKGMPRPEKGRTFSGVRDPLDVDMAALQPRINAAIDKGVDWLLKQQYRDGSFGHSWNNYPNGGTALGLLTLLKSGVPADDPAVLAAIDWLQRRRTIKTYSRGCLMQALAALNDPKHKEWAQRVLDDLIDTEAISGGWNYPGGHVDLSCTQFAALGLLGAEKLGLRVPDDLWREMANRLLSDFQPHFEMGTIIDGAGGTATRGRIGGFSYHRNNKNHPVSGSMTTAGLSILALAELYGGNQVKGKMARRIDAAQRQALGWLQNRFAVNRNPNFNGRKYYYLYGLERVGALMEIDKVGLYPWYGLGAKHLVDTQKGGGEWGRFDETCFALLFLVKATAPTTGGSQEFGRKTVFTQSEGDISVRAAGETDFSFFVIDLAKKWKDDGLAIERARWFVDGKKVATVEGDAEKPWKGQSLATRFRFDKPGQHEIYVEVDAMTSGLIPKTLKSKPLKVNSRFDFTRWMASNRRTFEGRNVLDGSVESCDASSTNGNNVPRQAADSFEASHWLAARNDKEPRLNVTFKRPVAVDAVVISPPGGNVVNLGRFGRCKGVDVFAAGRKVGSWRASPGEDLNQPITVRLEDHPSRLGGLTIALLDRDTDKDVGIAEIRCLSND